MIEIVRDYIERGHIYVMNLTHQIVDLERNDLNKICIPGTVKVRELFKVETYATVFHLVADVIGRLRDDFTIVDILKAVFPGGSITGAPKVRAMEIIVRCNYVIGGRKWLI